MQPLVEVKPGQQHQQIKREIGATWSKLKIIVWGVDLVFGSRTVFGTMHVHGYDDCISHARMMYLVEHSQTVFADKVQWWKSRSASWESTSWKHDGKGMQRIYAPVETQLKATALEMQPWRCCQLPSVLYPFCTASQGIQHVSRKVVFEANGWLLPEVLFRGIQMIGEGSKKFCLSAKKSKCWILHDFTSAISLKRTLKTSRKGNTQGHGWFRGTTSQSRIQEYLNYPWCIYNISTI